jgi:hypothetical protein
MLYRLFVLAFLALVFIGCQSDTAVTPVDESSGGNASPLQKSKATPTQAALSVVDFHFTATWVPVVGVGNYSLELRGCWTSTATISDGSWLVASEPSLPANQKSWTGIVPSPFPYHFVVVRAYGGGVFLNYVLSPAVKNVTQEYKMKGKITVAGVIPEGPVTGQLVADVSWPPLEEGAIGCWLYFLREDGTSGYVVDFITANQPTTTSYQWGVTKTVAGVDVPVMAADVVGSYTVVAWLAAVDAGGNFLGGNAITLTYRPQ